ncbi:MAG: DUF1353 domain-containing protein [Acidimicrobiales bacterium]
MSEPTEPDRFFDAESGGRMVLQLEPDGARFRILRPFGYRDPRHAEPFIVPADVVSFRTDLASIPWFVAWLVPGLGTHLPAVLLHDGLVVNPGEGKTHIGPDIDREEADRILRDAMASLGTPVVRRWLMWTAVIMATAFSALRPRWRWAALVVGTFAVVGVLGVVATLDLVDVADVLPWMGDRSWTAEVLWGATFALVVPLVISLLWGRLWRAGAIAGLALALLLHVTAAVMLVYGIYWVVERLASAREGTSPSAHVNLEEADTSQGRYLPAE